MQKTKYTFAKRQRELAKKKKKEEKRLGRTSTGQDDSSTEASADDATEQDASDEAPDAASGEPHSDTIDDS